MGVSCGGLIWVALAAAAAAAKYPLTSALADYRRVLTSRGCLKSYLVYMFV